MAKYLDLTGLTTYHNNLKTHTVSAAITGMAPAVPTGVVSGSKLVLAYENNGTSTDVSWTTMSEVGGITSVSGTLPIIATTTGGAVSISHSTDNGYKHLPASAGQSDYGKVVKLNSSGEIVWAEDNDTTYTVFGRAATGLVPAAPTGTSTVAFLREDGTWTVPVGTTYSQGEGITISTANQIINAGVRSVSEGTDNGTILVNTNGNSASVSVHGLKTAAYKDYTVVSAEENPVMTTVSYVSNAINSALANTPKYRGGVDRLSGSDTSKKYLSDYRPIKVGDYFVSTSEWSFSYTESSKTYTITMNIGSMLFCNTAISAETTITEQMVKDNFDIIPNDIESISTAEINALFTTTTE